MLSLRATALGMAILLGSIAPGKWAETARVEANHETSVAVPTLDRFGGMDIKVSDARGYFRVEKIGDRWVFVTPEGNAFCMLGVFDIQVTTSIDDLGDSYHNRIHRKYNPTGELKAWDTKWVWGRQVVRRLQSWLFNTIAEYADGYVYPVPWGPWAELDRSNSVKMPMVVMMQLVGPNSGLINRGGYAPGPFKDLRAGTSVQVAPGLWRGAGTPDVFDPNFEAYVRGSLDATQQWMPEAYSSPWIIGFAADDADYLVGFGPGPEVAAPRLHDHIGWLVLATNFEQKANAALGVTYADPKVYSKYVLRDFLKTKYGTLEALNGAWGANYTSFDSDGGWGSGMGLLDENGRHTAWLGRPDGTLAGAAPAVVKDLDDFLYEYAKQYFSTIATAFREHDKNHLLFGPATLNGWGGLTRKEILRAAGEYLDVLQVGVSSQQALDLTAKYAGDIPIVTWEGLGGNPDSALWRHPAAVDGVSILRTQEERGRGYARRVRWLLSLSTATGTKPVAGIKWWRWVDSWGEKTNWGLVSFLDNAYDGEAVRAPGKDPAGYPTGGEERDYGDFLSLVRQTNTAVLEELRQELAAKASQGDSALAGSKK